MQNKKPSVLNIKSVQLFFLKFVKILKLSDREYLTYSCCLLLVITTSFRDPQDFKFLESKLPVPENIFIYYQLNMKDTKRKYKKLLVVCEWHFNNLKIRTVFPLLNAHPLLSPPSNKRPPNFEMLEISAPF